jgi:putative FmdB family regulatory protein
MPQYEYKCEKCKKSFSKIMTVTEHDTKRAKCPKCKSVRVKPVYSGFFASTSKKS